MSLNTADLEATLISKKSARRTNALHILSKPRTRWAQLAACAVALLIIIPFSSTLEKSYAVSQQMVFLLAFMVATLVTLSIEVASLQQRVSALVELRALESSKDA